jgi:hypothetical protein
MESEKLHVVLDEISAEINRRLPDALAFNEHSGGGIFCVYAKINADDLDRGHVYVIGTANENWGASVYTAPVDDAAIGDNCVGEVETDISSESADAIAIVDAILRGHITPNRNSYAGTTATQIEVHGDARLERLTLVALLGLANEAYPDDELAGYFDPKTGEPRQGDGDGLAQFIVRELRDTFDRGASRDGQIEEARRCLNNAIRELELVIECFR